MATLQSLGSVAGLINLDYGKFKYAVDQMRTSADGINGNVEERARGAERSEALDEFAYFSSFFRFAFAEFFCDWILSLAVFNLSIFFSFAARFDSFSAFSRSRALFSLRASHTLALFLLSSAEFSAILSTPLSYKFFYVCAFIW